MIKHFQYCQRTSDTQTEFDFTNSNNLAIYLLLFEQILDL